MNYISSTKMNPSKRVYKKNLPWRFKVERKVQTSWGREE
jgi:hypothetical protein